MGRRTHSQDKLWITYKELVQDWGGKPSEEGISSSNGIQHLPFYCCSLSFLPFKDPVCLVDGTIFDICNILPYIRKYKKNPITGKPLKASELIKLNFHKNAEGDYHCPITYKVFTENSTIIAIRETGNVYSYEAYDELNKRPKNYKDLLTDQPFDPSNVIVIQDPNRSNEKLVSSFHFIKNKEEVEFIQNNQEEEDEAVNLPSTYAKLIENYEVSNNPEKIRRSEVLSMINNKQNITEEDARLAKIKNEYNEYLEKVNKLESEIESIDSVEKFKSTFNMSTQCFIYYLQQKGNDIFHERFSEGKTAGSLTSTTIDPDLTNQLRRLTDDELRQRTYYTNVKGKQRKGFVRMNTNFGYLNIQIHCDLVPKTAENFLELCESGYYDNTIFHRMVKNFIIQGGDPTRTGKGGVSIYGKAFNDEFHQLLSHKSRGVLSMANSGKNTNGSQFFITLKNGSALHLDNRHSVFGEIVGNIKVLDEIEMVGSDEKDVPKKEIKILNVEVFLNPFRDEITQLLMKDFSAKYVTETKKSELAKEKEIEERINISTKKLVTEKQKNSSEIGKYLNRKRESSGILLLSHKEEDPYIYEKPPKKDRKKSMLSSSSQFQFNDW